MKVIVFHAYNNCESGCCGHTVKLDDGREKFMFGHPDDGEDPVEFAKALVTEAFGADHVADLDWANCRIVDD